jgi:prophage DNA circulation protein
MSTPESVANVEKQLRGLIESRIDAGRELARKAADLGAARTAAVAAERAYAEAFTAATAAGWTAPELRKALKSAGLELPTATPTRQRSTARRPRAPIAPADAQEPTSADAPTTDQADGATTPTPPAGDQS